MAIPPQQSLDQDHCQLSAIAALATALAVALSLYVAMGMGLVISHYTNRDECGHLCGLFGFLLLGTGGLIVIGLPLGFVFMYACTPAFDDDLPRADDKCAHNVDAEQLADGQSECSGSERPLKPTI
jgi:hypothetical protein